jgi:hypothetical protein
MRWVEFGAIFSQAHLVTLVSGHRQNAKINKKRRKGFKGRFDK